MQGTRSKFTSTVVKRKRRRVRCKLTVGKWNVLLLFKWSVYPRVKTNTKVCQYDHNQKSKCPFINTRGAITHLSAKNFREKIRLKLSKKHARLSVKVKVNFTPTASSPRDFHCL